MSESPKAVIPINLPDAYPWGVATFGSETGEFLSSNAHMQSIYGAAAGGSIDTLFALHAEKCLSDVFGALDAGETWSGRLYPKQNKHGIASVEVMLQKDPESAGVVWIYTLEHPKVKDTVRFSSRSELQMLQVLLDNTLEYVFFRDVSGHFILTNRAFREAVADGEKMPGVDYTIEDFVSAESSAWIHGLDADVRESGQPAINQVFKVQFNSGLDHWLQLSTVPVRSSEGDIIGSLSVARDISDLKQKEADLHVAIDQAKEASRAKGQFLAAMSHEIRTPINGIIGASELCQETRLDVEQRNYLDTVLQCGSTLLALVNDVLDFSKIEAGQLNLERLNFSPRSLIENVVEEFIHEARKKGIELIAAYDDELPAYLMGDPTRLRQVLSNLISNAVKFTERGEIVLRADTVLVTNDSARVLFSVKDTGIGISEERQEAIFSSFTQADMSTTRKYGGTGLGLSICRELVSLMKGDISVTSEENAGSVFSFQIPFELTAFPGAEVIPFNPELAGLRVLIVDDNETNRSIYRQMCSGWGYRSAEAKDGVAALALLEEAVEEKDAFALCLLDQQMPGLSGLDLASLIQSRAELKATKLLLLSSSLDRSESLRASKLGISRALSKPVKRHTLLEVILETFDVTGSSVAISREPELIVDDAPSSLNVLLTEDNPVNQAVATQRLKKLGHKVTLAENGQEAVDCVMEQRFDCILMDIQMPGMDGYETTARIREWEQANEMAPQRIVAMTAHAMKGDEESCREAGMDDYLSKPFRVERLKEVLSAASAAKRSLDEQALSFEDVSFKDYLESLDEEDRGDLLAAAKIFVQTLPRDIAKLEQALADADYEQAYFVAHTLKGVSGIFGNQACIVLAEQLESDCKEKRASSLPESAAQFIEAIQKLTLEVEAELHACEQEV